MYKNVIAYPNTESSVISALNAGLNNQGIDTQVSSNISQRSSTQVIAFLLNESTQGYLKTSYLGITLLSKGGNRDELDNVNQALEGVVQALPLFSDSIKHAQFTNVPSIVPQEASTEVMYSGTLRVIISGKSKKITV